MTDDREGYEFCIKSVDVPTCDFYIFVGKFCELYFFLWFLYNFMDEKLSLCVYELTVCDPCDGLVEEYLLALFKDGTRPGFYPSVSFVV